MFGAYQEHCDHEASAFRSEQEAAYSLSCREFDNGKRDIKRLTDAGRFVVASGAPVYCRFTDAALPGLRYFVESHHATREEAEAAAEKAAEALDGCEAIVEVHPLKSAPASHALADDGSDDIPF